MVYMDIKDVTKVKIRMVTENKYLKTPVLSLASAYVSTVIAECAGLYLRSQ